MCRLAQSVSDGCIGCCCCWASVSWLAWEWAVPARVDVRVRRRRRGLGCMVAALVGLRREGCDESRDREGMIGNRKTVEMEEPVR